MEKTMENNLTYTKHGDYWIPNVELSHPETPSLGKYGMMFQAHLEKNDPIRYSELLLDEELFPHLWEMEQQAQKQIDQMVSSMMEAAGVTPELKTQDMMEWTRRMNSLIHQAEEQVLPSLLDN